MSATAQQTITLSLPVSVVNQTPLTNEQCVDGLSNGQPLQVVVNRRFYHNDIYQPFDTYYLGGDSSQWMSVFLFDQSTVTLNNINNNAVSLLGSGKFNIKSWGRPLNVSQSVVIGRIDDGIKFIGHGTNTQQSVAQIVYNMFRQGYTVGGLLNLTPFSYQTSLNSLPLIAPAVSGMKTNASYLRTGKECLNIYVSRCGDGYIDAPGVSNHTVPLVSGSLANEKCDPGISSLFTDDVMPGGVIATANYNCTATCMINSNPDLTIDKQQKLASSSTYEGVGLGTNSNISYTTPAAFDFKIIIKNNGGDAINVIMTDTLPAGFVMNALPGGCTGVLSNGSTVACNAQVGTSLTSQSFALASGQTATFTVKGILSAGVMTNNSVYATYTNPSNNVSTQTATDTVLQNPIQNPILVYTKTVRNVTTNSNGGNFVEADTQSSAVTVKTGDAIQYQITVNKTGGPVANTILSDVLPVNNGFLLSAYSINGGVQISATSFPATNITSLLNAGPVTVTLYGIVGSPTATAFVNTAILTENAISVGLQNPLNPNAWTVLENTPPPTPDVSIKKEVETSLNSNIRQELTTIASGQTVKFKITYQNISSVNANPTITDTLPAGLTCVSVSLPNNTTIPCTNNSFTYPAGVLVPGAIQSIVVTAVANSTLSAGVTTNTATITLPVGPGLPNGLVKSDPAQVQLQTVTDFIITKRILSGSVIPGTVMRYEIGFKNTGNTPIASYTLTDPLQNSTYVAGSSRLNNSIIITPSYASNILTRGCNSTNTALNGQTVCPLQAGASGTIVFDVLVN